MLHMQLHTPHFNMQSLTSSPSPHPALLQVITGKSIKAGDVVLGMASSGVHSNGFSLVRKVLEVAGVSLHDPAPWGGNSSAGAALLEPTVIYVKRVIALHEQVGTWLTAGRRTVVDLLTAGWARGGGAYV
jgi:hypothetical protein